MLPPAAVRGDHLQLAVERPLQEVAALWNYLTIMEDRSLGVHNPTYVIQILTDSVAALDPSFDTSLRP